MTRYFFNDIIKMKITNIYKKGDKNMKKNMLVVVDMVNGFVNFGALADNKINKITPKIIKLIESAKKNGMVAEMNNAEKFSFSEREVVWE